MRAVLIAIAWIVPSIAVAVPVTYDFSALGYVCSKAPTYACTYDTTFSGVATIDVNLKGEWDEVREGFRSDYDGGVVNSFFSFEWSGGHYETSSIAAATSQTMYTELMDLGDAYAMQSIIESGLEGGTERWKHAWFLLLSDTGSLFDDALNFPIPIDFSTVTDSAFGFSDITRRLIPEEGIYGPEYGLEGGFTFTSLSVREVPEPSTLTLFALALFGAVLASRKQPSTANDRIES